MLNDREAGLVLERLQRRYPDLKFADFNRRDPFRTLISCIISQRTRDEQTFEVARGLFRRAKTPSAIAALGTVELEHLLHKAGFYRQKARHIRGVCNAVLERFGGKTPGAMEELLSLPGVGRKTANIVLSFGFGVPAIAVDTHAHRISNRLGLVKTKTPLETELELAQRIDRKHWIVLNNLLVRHGQDTCKPVNPKCGVCGVASMCEQRAEEQRAEEQRAEEQKSKEQKSKEQKSKEQKSKEQKSKEQKSKRAKSRRAKSKEQKSRRSRERRAKSTEQRAQGVE